MGNARIEVKTMIDYDFMGNTISLVRPAAGKETFILLNRHHTDVQELSKAIGVSIEEANEFLPIDSPDKPLKTDATLEKAQLRLICLLGYAGSKISNT